VNFPFQQDRRRWRRFAFGVPVRILTAKSVVEGRSIRMSEGGVSVFALVNLSLGARVSVQFTLPHANQPLSIAGVVRSRAVYLYGVEFLKEDEPDQQKIGLLRNAFTSTEVSQSQVF
jgi:hypothetical protein